MGARIRPRLDRLRRWRFAVSAVAIYALVLQALIGGVALAAPLGTAGESALVICKSESGDNPRLGEISGAAHHEHGDLCICQGLCAHHGGAAPLPSFRAAGLLAGGEASRLALPSAITAAVPHSLRQSGFARAPPRSGRDIA
jgi:hypothetical protein